MLFTNRVDRGCMVIFSQIGICFKLRQRWKRMLGDEEAMTRLVQLRLIPQILSAHPSPNQAAWDNRTAKSFCPLHNRVRIPQGEIFQSIISPDGTIFSKQRSCPENSDAIAQNNLLPTNDCSTNNLFHIPLLQNICSQRLLNFELCSDWSRTACNSCDKESGPK